MPGQKPILSLFPLLILNSLNSCKDVENFISIACRKSLGLGNSQFLRLDMWKRAHPVLAPVSEVHINSHTFLLHEYNTRVIFFIKLIMMFSDDSSDLSIEYNN